MWGKSKTLPKECMHKQVCTYIVSTVHGPGNKCNCCTAADVFKLLEQPEHSKKKLEVCASYFEIYLGKVLSL